MQQANQDIQAQDDLIAQEIGMPMPQESPEVTPAMVGEAMEATQQMPQ